MKKTPITYKFLLMFSESGLFCVLRRILRNLVGGGTQE